MKIPVNLKLLSIDMDKLIKEQLKVRNLPECLGCMFPPLIETEPEVEITDLFVEPESVDKHNIMKLEPTKIVPSEHADKVRQAVISKQSYDVINSQMNEIAAHYANNLSKCAKPCPHVDICFKLTTNYLKLVEVSLNN